jgi:hypothetical protein
MLVAGVVAHAHGRGTERLVRLHSWRSSLVSVNLSDFPRRIRLEPQDYPLTHFRSTPDIAQPNDDCLGVFSCHVTYEQVSSHIGV